MEAEKQQTVKRHFLLVAFGTIGVLTLLSLAAPFDAGAPKTPKDETHQNSHKVVECLNCHRPDATAARKQPSPKPMRHELRANCKFCHAQK